MQRTVTLATQLIDQVTAWIHPRLAKHSRARMRRLLALRDGDVARQQQALALAGRLKERWLDHSDAPMSTAFLKAAEDLQVVDQWLLDVFEPNDPPLRQLSRWRAVEDSKPRRRKVATSSDITVHPLWKLPPTHHATCAANWLFGRFPADKETVRWVLGANRYDAIDEALRRAFLTAKWTKRTMLTVVHLLELLSDHLPLPLRTVRLRPRTNQR